MNKINKLYQSFRGEFGFRKLVTEAVSKFVATGGDMEDVPELLREVALDYEREIKKEIEK